MGRPRSARACTRSGEVVPLRRDGGLAPVSLEAIRERGAPATAPLVSCAMPRQRAKTPPKMSVLPNVAGQSCCGAGRGSGVVVVSAWR